MKRRHFVRNTIIISILFVLAAVLVTGFMLFLTRRDNRTYQEAIQLRAEGDLQAAYAKFKEVRTFEDSPLQMKEILAEDPTAQFQDLQVGDIVTLGKYEQDSDDEEGTEIIRWIILEQEGSRYLLLSERVLDCKPYHSKWCDITWEKCALRKWLQTDFLENSFTDTERKIISETENINLDNIDHGTEGGKMTTDTVFLLSEAEVNYYCSDDYEQWLLSAAAEPSAYAVHQGVYLSNDGKTQWWIRSPGVDPYSAEFVDLDGTVYTSGAYVDIDYRYGVRPCIWVDIDREEEA